MAQSTISQRIALEGAEDILKQLAELGQAGEKAVKQIQDASAGMSSSGFAGLSNIAATLQGAFGRVGEALAPVRTAFSELGEAAAVVGERLTRTAEIFGIGFAAGIAGGIAGLAELVKGTLESSHQLEVQAGVLGVTVEQLQVYRAAAAAAGVDSDKVFTALARLAQNVGKEYEKLSQDTIKLFEGLGTSATAAGTAVVQGFAPVGAGVKGKLVDTLAGSANSINGLVDAFVKVAAEQGKALSPVQIENYRQDVRKAAADVTSVGEAFRIASAAKGFQFPPLTVGEDLKVNAEIAKAPLLALGVSLKDLQDAGGQFDPIIGKVIDGLDKVEDPTRKAALALPLLGRGWKEVLAAFDGGSASLDRVRAALEANGLLLSKDQVEAGAEAEKAFVSLQGAAKRLTDQLILIFAPSIIDAAKAFKQLIIDNASTLKAWAEAIAGFVAPSVKNLADQFGVVGEAAKKLPDVISGKTGSGVAHPAAIPTAEVFGPPVPPELLAPNTSGIEAARQKIEQFKESIKSLQEMLAPALKILQAALDGIAFAINSVFGTNLNEAGAAAVLVVGRVSGAFARLREGLGLVGGAISGLAILFGAPAATVAALAGPITLLAVALVAAGIAIVAFQPQIEALQQRFSDFAQSIGTGIAAGFTSAVTAVGNFLAGIPASIQAVVSAVAPALSVIPTAISQAIQGAAAAVGQALGNFFGQTLPELIGGATGLFPGLWSHLGDGLALAITAIREAIDSLTGFITKSVGIILGALRDIGDFISSIASKVAGLGASAATAAAGGGGSPDSGGLGVDTGGDGALTPGFASGGHIARGPAGIDRIPAMLSLNEFVIRADAVRHYGADLFHALNSMALPIGGAFRGFSLGGLVELDWRPPRTHAGPDARRRRPGAGAGRRRRAGARPSTHARRRGLSARRQARPGVRQAGAARAVERDPQRRPQAQLVRRIDARPPGGRVDAPRHRRHRIAALQRARSAPDPGADRARRRGAAHRQRRARQPGAAAIRQIPQQDHRQRSGPAGARRRLSRRRDHGCLHRRAVRAGRHRAQPAGGCRLGPHRRQFHVLPARAPDAGDGVLDRRRRMGRDGRLDPRIRRNLRWPARCLGAPSISRGRVRATRGT